MLLLLLELVDVAQLSALAALAALTAEEPRHWLAIGLLLIRIGEFGEEAALALRRGLAMSLVLLVVKANVLEVLLFGSRRRAIHSAVDRSSRHAGESG